MIRTKIWSFFGSLKRASHWNLEVFQVHSNVPRTEILTFFRFTQMCFALKSWVFPVHSNFVLRSPEKLKISGLSTFYVHLKKLKISVLRTFSVHLKNIKISVFCTFYVHKKNSRFQCSASMFTDKTQVRNKKCKKNEENSGCSMYLFYTQSKIILRSKYGRKGAFTVEYWQNLHVSGKCLGA